jgi:hypothetical protein
MEVNLKHNIAKLFSSLFIVIFSFAFTGLAAAHGDHDGDRHDGWHGNRHGDRIATTWMIADAINTFQVDAPVNPPLRYVKMRVMARTGLPVKYADLFVVELLTTTTTNLPTRDPSCLPTATTPCLPVFTPTTTTSFEMLDESLSLKDLGIVEGDTLRIRQVAEPDPSSTPHHHGHEFHADAGDHGKGHHH